MELAGLQYLRAGTDPFRCRLRLVMVGACSVGYEAGDGSSVPGNHNLFSLLDLIQQATQSVLRFKCANFPHRDIPSLSLLKYMATHLLYSLLYDGYSL